jgi:hypothetical protein
MSHGCDYVSINISCVAHTQQKSPPSSKENEKESTCNTAGDVLTGSKKRPPINVDK